MLRSLKTLEVWKVDFPNPICYWIFRFICADLSTVSYICLCKLYRRKCAKLSSLQGSILAYGTTYFKYNKYCNHTLCWNKRLVYGNYRQGETFSFPWVAPEWPQSVYLILHHQFWWHRIEQSRTDAACLGMELWSGTSSGSQPQLPLSTCSPADLPAICPPYPKMSPTHLQPVLVPFPDPYAHYWPL